jgi:two-component system response regulator AtoC
MKNHKVYTLFVMEEGEAYTFLLKYKLQKSPEYKVLHYHTGEEVVENLHQKPDVVIIDDKFSGSGSSLLLQALKRNVPKIPVIILSSPGNTSAFLEHVRDGIHDYLIKEEDSAQLADKLINRIVKIIKQREMKDLDLQHVKILTAIVVLVLSIAVIFWFIY